jgi:hypothetical protein
LTTNRKPGANWAFGRTLIISLRICIFLLSEFITHSNAQPEQRGHLNKYLHAANKGIRCNLPENQHSN